MNDNAGLKLQLEEKMNKRGEGGDGDAFLPIDSLCLSGNKLWVFLHA